MQPKDAHLNVSSIGSMAQRKRREKESEKQSITKPDLQDLHVDVNLCSKRSLGQLKRWEKKKKKTTYSV